MRNYPAEHIKESQRIKRRVIKIPHWLDLELMARLKSLGLTYTQWHRKTIDELVMPKSSRCNSNNER